MSKYGVFSGPYSSIFGLNTGKDEPEETPYLNNFHAVLYLRTLKISFIKNTKYFINPFSTNVPLLYPPENIRKPPTF